MLESPGQGLGRSDKMKTYRETARTETQVKALHKKLKSKNFELIDKAYYTELWENPATEEHVIIEILL